MQAQRDQAAARLQQDHRAALAAMADSHITELRGLREGEAVRAAEHETARQNLELQAGASAELQKEHRAALAEMADSHITELRGLREGEAALAAEHATARKDSDFQAEANAELRRAVAVAEAVAAAAGRAAVAERVGYARKKQGAPSRRQLFVQPRSVPWGSRAG